MCNFHRNGTVHGDDLSTGFSSTSIYDVKKQTHADFAVNRTPTLRERDLVAPSCVVELIKVPIGDRSPFDSKLADVNLLLRMLIIPPEFVVLYLFGGIVILGLIMAQGNSLRAQCNCR